MIELNNKTRQDFLDREWCEKLMEYGVDMNDAKYFISGNWEKTHEKHKEFVALKSEYENWNDPTLFDDPIPTYTLSELLYKLNEWPYEDGIINTIKDTPVSNNSGGLTFFKDAPFYCFFYKNWEDSQDTYSEYPIYAAASLLLWCIKHDVSYSKDISNK